MLNLSLLGCLEVVDLWWEKQNKKAKKASFNEINSSMKLIARAEIEAGVVAKADQ